jgi:transcription antitermination factor NusG
MYDWKVLFVKPRTEKKVAEYCRLYRIPYYLPLCERHRIVQRRKVLVHLPLFAGYVFAEFPVTQRLQLLQTNCLVSILEPPSGFGLARQLVAVRRMLSANPEISAEPPLAKGVRVRIIDGPLMGVEGLVEEITGKTVHKVVINIEMIGQAVSTTVAAADLEVVPK